MKKYTFLLIALTCLLLFSACEEELDPAELISVDHVELIDGQIKVTYTDGYVYPLGSLENVSMIYIRNEDGTYAAQSTASSSAPNELSRYFGDQVKRSAATERGICYEYVMINGKPYKSFMGAVSIYLKEILTEQTVPAQTSDGATVTGLANGAFQSMTNLTKVTLPNTITKIDMNAFLDCSALKEIEFLGTQAEWEAIEKAVGWNVGVDPEFVIHCTDGDITG